ncbi:MAG: hypothetical protein U5K43_07485 [Halofilum sp. (in: g-proteobacteria)]|nr:hypothetical protein [Halofilum sp. (in: g-proteobacteria)]
MSHADRVGERAEAAREHELEQQRREADHGDRRGDVVQAGPAGRTRGGSYCQRQQCRQHVAGGQQKGAQVPLAAPDCRACGGCGRFHPMVDTL